MGVFHLKGWESKKLGKLFGRISWEDVDEKSRNSGAKNDLTKPTTKEFSERFEGDSFFVVPFCPPKKTGPPQDFENEKLVFRPEKKALT